MIPFLLTSHRVVSPGGIRPLGLLIDAGKIRSVHDRAALPRDVPARDFGNLLVMPGLVDTHVHVNDPGRELWEGFLTATRAAAAGGITTLVDMPLNSIPATIDPDALRAKLAAARGRIAVDVGFHGGIVPANAGSLASLLASGILGVKAFLVHSGVEEFPNVGEAELRLGMGAIASSGLPLLVHAELESPLAVPQSDPRSYGQYVRSRPPQMETAAIAMLIRLCREFGTRLHIVHLAAAEGVALLAAARAEGLPITVETCPHYLFFASEEIGDGDTRFKCAPPIRSADNREALWAALTAGALDKSGVIDFIATDHSPCDPALKSLDQGSFVRAWGGISGLQLSLPVVWTAARERGFTPTDLVRWLCAGPAALVGLAGRKGGLEPGCDADIVVWDPDATVTVGERPLFHRHQVTPYAGRTLQGMVRATFLRGREIFDGITPVDGHGELILRT